MSEAQDAYEEAQRLIAEAIAEGYKSLNFDNKACHALKVLPPEIAQATTVTMLDLDNTQVTDLAPIAGLNAITQLYLNYTQVTDLSPIAELNAITKLGFSHTEITDLSPIAGLSAITTIDLANSQVTDLSPIAELNAITTIDLADSQTKDFSTFSTLSQLKNLYIERSSFADLSLLPQGTDFEDLHLQDSQVADLRPLLDLTFAQVQTPFGLTFANTPATAADPRLAEIAEIENNDERLKTVLEYLRGISPDPAPQLKDIEGLLRGPILSDTLTDVTKPQSRFEATSLSDHPDKTPDEKFNDIVSTLEFAAQKLGATDVQNRLGEDVAQSFREYTTFVTQDPLNPRILRFLGDSIRGAISNEDTAAALDAFDVPLFENFLREHDSLLSGYFNRSLAPVEFDVETDPDKLIRDLFPQLDAARKILADADAAGLFAPSVSDALEMLHRRAEGARKKIITTGDNAEREAAVADLRRASVLTTSFLGRIKGRLTQWVEKQTAFAKENPGTTVLAADGLYGVATKVIEQVTPIFDALWKLIGNLPLPF